MTAGKLHVVGVGPGDPELMTIKAARILAASPVVAYLCKHGRPGHARSTAASHVAPGCEELRFEYPFTTELDVGEPRYLADMACFYERAARAIAGRLDMGHDVALLCEGDPFFYGSAMYLFDHLGSAYRHEVVPGVTGMSGCWTRAGLPMTHGDDVLAVLPGTLDEDTLAARLSACDAAVVMKLGRNLPKVRAAVARAGLTQRALYVERGTMAGEIVRPLAEVTQARVPYFALVLIPGRQGAR